VTPRKYQNTLICAAVALTLLSVFIFIKYLGDLQGGRFGGDLLTFWQTGHRAFDGNIAAIYEPEYWRHLTVANAPDLITWFVYPPYALFGLWPLGALDYQSAVWVWSLAPLPLYFFFVMRTAARAGLSNEKSIIPFAILVGMAAPYLLCNLLYGQTAAFVAVLLLGAAYFWRTRPIVAGLCIGLLAVKPQMGLLIPFALLAARQWRTIFSAAVTIIALVLAATLWLGPQIWLEYLQMTQIFSAFLGLNSPVLTLPAVGPYVSLIGAGLPARLAMTLQILITLGVIAAITQTFWRGREETLDLRLGLLAAGTLLATPYALAYDTPLLMLSVAPMFARAWRGNITRLELCALFALLIVPFAQPMFMKHDIPYGFLAVAAWFCALYSRERATSPARQSANDNPSGLTSAA